MTTREAKRWRNARRRFSQNPGYYTAIALQVAERELREAVRGSLTVIEGGKQCQDTSSTSKPTGSSMT